MLDASQLFRSPPSSIVDVISTVLEIFGQEWQTLMGLSALYLLSAIALGITIGIFLAIFFAKEVAILMQFLAAANAGRRYLLDYATGISGASRLLEESYSYGQSNYNSQMNPDALSGKFAVFPVIFVLAVITLAFFASVYVGSLTHASKWLHRKNNFMYDFHMKM